MKMDRLFEIVYLLLDKKQMTAQELANHFEVSTRTIYRDVEQLAQAGIPLYMTKGKGGGISVLPDYVLNKVILTQQEKQEILMALQGLKTVIGEAQSSASLKLGSLFGIDQQQWIEVDFANWQNRLERQQLFETLKTAILNRKLITLDYFNSKGEHSKRQVEPLKLVFKGQDWYLYGFCRVRNDYRFFKINRIECVVVLEEVISKTAPNQVLTREVYHEELIDLTIQVNQSMGYRVYEEFASHQIDFDEQGNFIIQLSFPKGLWLWGYLLSYGDQLRVLAPEAIRRGMRERLNTMMTFY